MLGQVYHFTRSVFWRRLTDKCVFPSCKTRNYIEHSCHMWIAECLPPPSLYITSTLDIPEPSAILQQYDNHDSPSHQFWFMLKLLDWTFGSGFLLRPSLPHPRLFSSRLFSWLLYLVPQGRAAISSHRPEVILNNFGTRLGHSVGRMLASIFHYDPEFKGRRVVTFHNQRDYIFFRHHRWAHQQRSYVYQMSRFKINLACPPLIPGTSLKMKNVLGCKRSVQSSLCGSNRCRKELSTQNLANTNGFWR